MKDFVFGVKIVVTIGGVPVGQDYPVIVFEDGDIVDEYKTVGEAKRDWPAGVVLYQPGANE